MDNFDVEKFISNPSSELETIVYAKKVDLIQLARELGLTVRINMRKAQICDMIIHHLMNANVLGIEARDFLSEDLSSVGLTAEQKLEFEKIALEREKAQLALQQERERAQASLALAEKKLSYFNKREKGLKLI